MGIKKAIKTVLPLNLPPVPVRFSPGLICFASLVDVSLRFVVGVFLIGTFFPLVPVLQAQPGLAATSGTFPNVLFIATDDLRVELGCYGQEWIHSPNLDKLASQSTLFTRAYCQAALCNPSRASLLTGLYPDTLGVIDLPTHFRRVVPDVTTLPEYFKNHGYFTQNIGKVFHNGHHGDMHGDPQSWSVPSELFYASHGTDVVTPPALIENQKNNTVSELLNVRAENYDVPDTAYFDGRIAEKAVAALGALAKEDRPFFLAVGFWKPHLPFNAPKKYWDYYTGNPEIKKQLLPENANWPEGTPGIAGHDGKELMRSFETKLDEEQIGLLREGYYAAVSYVDAQVGKVLDALDRLDLTENTVIVFWSDHGFHLGEKGLWCKNSCFDLDTRVPLIIRTAGQTKGQVSHSLVELVDLYPTLLELCGFPLDKPLAGQALQGRSLVPVLENPNMQVRQAAFSQNMRPTNAKLEEREAMGYTIRTERYRFTQWAKWVPGMDLPSRTDILAEELYDLEKDPRELVNLASNPKFNGLIADYRKELSVILAVQRKESRYE
ncbi:MAG: sulfatase [Verrucomicrobia bacterium]|nr:sulfatase [Verrucomicrobiota bacterium]